MTSSSSSQETREAFSERISHLLTGMAERLVDNPASIRLDVDDSSDQIVFRLYVAPEDLGKVIGKQGRTARSIRTILNAIGSKANFRLQLDVLEEHAGGSAAQDEENH